jgi:DNA-binding CsgD family transcriptional regulator
MAYFPEVEDQAGRTGRSYFDPGDGQTTDPLDCFNEDLVWIVDRLVTRSGGSFGIISRHVEGELLVTVLARTTDAPESVRSILPSLADHAKGAVSLDRRRLDDTPKLKLASWTPGAALGSESFRVLQLSFSPTQNVTLVASVGREDGDRPFSAIEELTAVTLYPVLSRYVRLWWLHRMERRRANSLSAALDLSDVGVMLLDRRGELVFANPRAGAILARQDGLKRYEHSIAAAEMRDGVRLQAAIQHALQCNLAHVENSGVDRCATILPLHRPSQGRALIATVMNVEIPAVDSRDPAVIIYVFDPDQDVEKMLAPVCGMYRLTDAEARLVRHLVRGLRISDAAQHMQVQPETARTYLKQVFIKTGTNRQVDLVRVMLASVMRTNAKIDLALLSAFG